MKQIRIVTLLMLVFMAADPIVSHAAGSGEVAQEPAEATNDVRKDMAERDYDEAKVRCRTLFGNAKNICMKNALVAYKTAKAQANMKGAKAQAEADEKSMEAVYKAAKARCDAMSGNAKNVCIGEAKLKYYSYCG